MIIEYNSKYDNDIKDLFYELQEYIMEIDKQGYNVISPEYKYDFFEKKEFKNSEFNKVMGNIKDYQGKMFLYKKDNKIVGLIVGSINNEETNDYDFKAPKRGRINELIINKDYRGQGIGQELFDSMEEYLKGLGCKAILIEVFGYNDLAKKFYEKKVFWMC